MCPDSNQEPSRPDGKVKQRRGAAQCFRDIDLPLARVWTYYFGIGGGMDEVSLDAYLHEALDIPSAQMDLVATALTELTRPMEGDRP